MRFRQATAVPTPRSSVLAPVPRLLILLSNSVPTTASMNHPAKRFSFGSHALASWPPSPEVLTVRAEFHQYPVLSTYTLCGTLQHAMRSWLQAAYDLCFVPSTAHLLDVLRIHPRHLEHAHPRQQHERASTKKVGPLHIAMINDS